MDTALVFEAIHGHAPGLEGRDEANPLPLLIPAVHMLRHLAEDEAADRIMEGVSAVFKEGVALTKDLGGTARTSEMVAAIIGKIPAAAKARA